MSDASPARCAIIGGGIAGLITASVLRRDGFDVTVFTKEAHAGGTWFRDRHYPMLMTNGIHHEFRFSDQQYTEVELAEATVSGRIKGSAVASYMERYARKHLDGVVRYETSVERLARPESGSGWVLTLRERDGRVRQEHFDKAVIASGLFFLPYIPSSLAATRDSFAGPVCHTSDLAHQQSAILAAVADKTSAKPGHVIVIGGGKSAVDTCTWLSSQERHVTQLTSEMRWPLKFATHKKAPDFARRSRMISLFIPHARIPSSLFERFLHGTRLGQRLRRYLVGVAEKSTLKAFDLQDKPYRPRVSRLWQGGMTGPGDADEVGSYWHYVLRTGEIKIVAGRAEAFIADGIRLTNGETMAADAIILATGFRDSIDPLFESEAARREAGLGAEPVDVDLVASQPFVDDAPSPITDDPQVMLLLRGLVPARNFERRDLALIGFATSFVHCYADEAAAHWISSYFGNEEAFSIKDQATAELEAKRDAAWLVARFPRRDCLVAGSSQGPCHSADLLGSVWGWADVLLRDLGLPPRRSGTGWNWWLKTISMDDLATIGQERARKREESQRSL